MDQDLIDFVRGYRGPVSIDEVASDLAVLGANGAEWPRASATDWKRSLNVLVSEGKLTSENNMLTVQIIKSDAPVQMELF